MTASYNSVSGTYDYGSVVRALQVQIAASGGTVKEYPYNYEGITKAIQDLTFQNTSGPASEIGPSPSMGDVIIDANGNPQFTYSTAPEDGTLWFDTRQGRLFIAYESQWYQTNGGDGFPIITANDTPPSASNLVLGQLWFETDNGTLYIWSGTYKEADNSIVTVPTTTTVPVWVQLVDTSAVQTTANLPLAGTNINAKLIEAVTNSNYLPTNFDPALMTNQDDANLYFIDGLLALDDQIKINSVSVGVTPPATPTAGELWFDTEDIELSVWYIEPGKSYGQWVPTFSSTIQDAGIANVKTLITTESNSRVTAFTELTSSLNALTATVTTNNTTATGSINSLQSQITAIGTVDLTPYITEVKEQKHITDLQNQINGTKADISVLNTTSATKAALSLEASTLQADVNTRATTTALNAVIASIPSITGLATETYVNTQVAASTGLTRTGDTLTGTITVDKSDISVPSIDYSTNYWDGRSAQKYQTYCDHATNHYTTFGTNNNLFEYAWAFDSNEDFAWVHSSNGKVASIDKTGIAATALYIATFGANTTNGRALTSTIDVGARLATYQTALTNLRSNAATATTLDELKTAIANALVNV